jgi:hypothetical protein
MSLTFSTIVASLISSSTSSLEMCSVSDDSKCSTSPYWGSELCITLNVYAFAFFSNFCLEDDVAYCLCFHGTLVGRLYFVCDIGDSLSVDCEAPTSTCHFAGFYVFDTYKHLKLCGTMDLQNRDTPYTCPRSQSAQRPTVPATVVSHTPPNFRKKPPATNCSSDQHQLGFFLVNSGPYPGKPNLFKRGEVASACHLVLPTSHRDIRDFWPLVVHDYDRSQLLSDVLPPWKTRLFHPQRSLTRPRARAFVKAS